MAVPNYGLLWVGTSSLEQIAPEQPWHVTNVSESICP